LQPSLSYLICCSERTGSTLLGNALISTGIAGRPRSYFNRVAHYNPKMQRILGNAKDDDNYLDKVVVAATTPNGVFGAKVMWGYFNGFVTGLRWAVPGRQRLSVCELAPSVFPDLRYLSVTRRDKVRQAVSLWRALQTWSWSSDQVPAVGTEHLVYSHAAIAHLIRDIEAHEYEWRAYFRECGVEPLTIVYEDFAGRYEETVRDILRHLEIPEAETAAIAAPHKRPQSDDLSRQWSDRYRAESGKLAHA
jgi:trehalose 2-sulfotransferase